MTSGASDDGKLRDPQPVAGQFAVALQLLGGRPAKSRAVLSDYRAAVCGHRMKTRLIIGCGYLGLRVAKRWRAQGDRVFAVTRSAERADAFRQQGLLPVLADVTRRDTLAALPAAETVAYSVGYDRTAGRSMREVYVAGLLAVLGSLPASVGRVIYISSTGVYGQSGGDWVHENSACEPTRESGRICLEAEQTLRAHALGRRAVARRCERFSGVRVW